MAKRMPRVACVHCVGTTALLDGIVREELPHDCAAIKAAHPEGIGVCSWGCLGGGSCEAACPFGAIHVDAERHVAQVDRKKCRGCGKCVAACPQHLISLAPAANVIQVRCSNQDRGPAARKACPNSCIGCGVCERVCPMGAVRVIDGRAVIDDEKCVACGMCATKCPRGAIHDANGIMAVR